MLKIGQNWGKIANYPPQCSTKICTPAWVYMPPVSYASDYFSVRTLKLNDGRLKHHFFPSPFFDYWFLISFFSFS